MKKRLDYCSYHTLQLDTTLLFGMPNRKNIYKSIPLLNGLSNTIGERDPYAPKDERIRKIQDNLKIPT